MLSLLGELEQAVDGADAAGATALTARLDGTLGAHTSREEHGRFSRLRRVEVELAREDIDLVSAAHQLLRPDQWDEIDALREPTSKQTRTLPEGSR